MSNVSDLSQEKQEEILRLASAIRLERYKDSKMRSLSESKDIVIRWGVSHKKYDASFFSVNVSADEVADLVKMKIYGDDNANQ